MKKQNIGIQIEYPDGYEFVRYGQPKFGDKVLLSKAITTYVGLDTDQSNPQFIFQKEQPKFEDLKVGEIFYSATGTKLIKIDSTVLFNTVVIEGVDSGSTYSFKPYNKVKRDERLSIIKN